MAVSAVFSVFVMDRYVLQLLFTAWRYVMLHFDAIWLYNVHESTTPISYEHRAHDCSDIYMDIILVVYIPVKRRKRPLRSLDVQRLTEAL